MKNGEKTKRKGFMVKRETSGGANGLSWPWRSFEETDNTNIEKNC